MSPELKEAIERVRHHKMTPEELFEQRVSFVYGQGSGDISKEQVRAQLAGLYGDPASIRREAALAERRRIAAWIESRADRIARHGGRASARQLRIAADEVRAGMVGESDGR